VQHFNSGDIDSSEENWYPSCYLVRGLRQGLKW